MRSARCWRPIARAVRAKSLAADALAALCLQPMRGALADAMEHAMTHYEQWRQLVPAAREHIERTFSPQAGMRRLEDLFITIASSR